MTIEPGYYEESGEDGGGGFGIRIENVYVCVDKDTPHCFGGPEGYIGFETLTVVPLQRTLIDTSLLTARQVEWIDTYHELVLAEVGPLLVDDPDTLAWLKQETKPL